MVKKMAQRAVSLLCVIVMLASVLAVPAFANNNEIGQCGYYEDGGEGNPHRMPIYSTKSYYFEFRGDDIAYLSADCFKGSANLSFRNMDWKAYNPDDPDGSICSGWIDITPTSRGKFGVFIFVNDGNGVCNGVYAKICLDVF